jgi:hypothetical protein
MILTLSPAQSQVSQAFEVVTLNILARDEDFVGLFDSLEVWRSRVAEGGAYEEVTGPAWRGARLPRLGGEPPVPPLTGPNVNIVGLTLELILNETSTIAVTFTGVDPLTRAQAAAQIQTQSLGRLRAWVDSSTQLVIETMEPGTAATLRVVTSDAASFLGLPLTSPASMAYGVEARPTLVQGQNSYTFSDKGGSSAYFYKTRFRNRLSNTVSEFGPTYSASSVIGVDPINVVVGYLDLIDSAGKPITGIEVSLRTPFVGALIAGKLVAGSDLVQKTDANGHVEFTLVRGQTYTLAISGTNIAKEIVSPTDQSVTSFLLVDDNFATQDDYFRARVPLIPTMERRSL